MKAREIREHFQAEAPWVDWDGQTCDQFLHGDPDAAVEGIAVGWIVTLEMAKQAADHGANLVVTHEPIFYDGYWRRSREVGQRERAVESKRKQLDRLGLTVLRCHDTWDRFPKVGIPDAWASFLGLSGYRRNPESFYGKATFAATTVRTLARRVLKKVQPLGQQHVEAFRPRAKVSSLCVGTGAITSLADMLDEVRADCYLVTNDGSNAWTTELHATDCDVPLIRVDHATAELPGIMALARYLAEIFPDVPVRYIPYPCPYRVLT